MKNSIIVCILLLIFSKCNRFSEARKDSAVTAAPTTSDVKSKMDSITTSEPFSFKEFQLGMKLDEFKKMKLKYLNKKIEKTREIYLIASTIADEKGHVNFLFYDYGEGFILDIINIAIPKSAHSKVLEALTLKYGKPKPPTMDESVNKLMGWPGTLLVWQQANSEIQINTINKEFTGAEILYIYKDYKNRKTTFIIERELKENMAKKDL